MITIVATATSEQEFKWLILSRICLMSANFHHGGKAKHVPEKGSNFKLLMGTHQIEKTNSYKYLGIIVDDNLNWKLQINKMCSKLSSVCGVISKVRHYLNRSSLILIYHSLFDSRLRYGILAWGTASEQYLSKLRVLQNRTIRFIMFSPFFLSYISNISV